MARRRTRKRKTRSRRKSRRKSRRRKSRRRKRTRQRGGNKVKFNSLNNKVMEPPISTNNNWNIPRNPAQSGGRKRRNSRRRKKRQRGGGSLLRAVGLGDVLQGYYSATDFASNTKNKWAGKKTNVSSNPIKQPKMMKSGQSQYKLPNVPEYHRVSSAKAAKHMLQT